jgi:2-keto-4-pentenoate hydratase/2-oxohepta-3-ene-1,7-dioic acid hydratase in catechol pathway
MRIIRYVRGGIEGYGILEGDNIREVSDPFTLAETGGRDPLAEVKLLAPVNPSKVVCVGLNYTDHAAELGMGVPEVPVIFIKPPTTVIGPGEDIIYPAQSKRVDYEAELGIVIGRTAKDVSVDVAGEYILGYTCVNDVTARDIQKIDGQWTRAKSFDTFCPVGPWIETEIDPSDILVEAYLNGQRVQSSSTKNMKHDVYDIVSFVSGVMTLNPGDIIATGTPPGIGEMQPGDEIEVRVEGIGSIKNRLV